MTDKVAREVNGSRVSRVTSVLDRFVSQYEAVVLIAFSIVYLGATLSASLRRPPWMDEVITLYDSPLPFGSMLALMRLGADSTAPLNYLLLKGLYLVTRPSPFVVRLPALLGFWCMLMCVYFILRRFLPNIYALAGAIFPLVTFVYFYSSEGRPYGLLLGFVGLLAVCWQWRARSDESKAPLLALAIASMGACATHYYGIVVMYPIAIGECFRTWERRKLDPGVWIALASGLIPIFLQLPFIRGLAKFALTDSARPNYFAHPSVKALLDTYQELLFPAIFAVAAVLCVALVISAALPHLLEKPAYRSSLPEIAMAGGFVSLPAVLLVVCMVTHGAYSIRYLAPAVIGFAIMLPMVVQSMARSNWAGYALAASLALIFPLNWYTLSWTGEASGRERFLQNSPDGMGLIAVAQGLDWMELSYTAPQDLRERLHYVSVGPDVASQYTDPTDERIISTLSGQVPFRVDPLEPFLQGNPQFVVFWRPDGRGSLVEVLKARGYRFELLSSSGPYQLLRAISPDSSPKL